MTLEASVDVAAFERLRRIGGDKLLAEILDTFLRTAPHRLREAHGALASGELTTLERVGHTLKTSCAHVGATRMREVALALEQAARGGEAARSASLVSELEAALLDLRPRLAAERQRLPAFKRVAVVEDNPDNRLLVRALLEDAYEVVEYETGAEALAGFGEQRPDLVLLDISLPGMDGEEVLRRLRADERLRAVPAIALTAHAMAGDRERYLGAGFNDYVSKPIVEETDLLKAVARCLQG